MSIIKEFREFAVKGNVMDMAVGVIIGGAFGKIVSSLVGDVVMPIFGIVTGKVNFSDLALTVGASTIAYGKFIQSVIDFVIVAFCIFLFVKQANRFRKHAPPPPPPAPTKEVELLTEIRDTLRKS